MFTQRRLGIPRAFPILSGFLATTTLLSACSFNAAGLLPGQQPRATTVVQQVAPTIEPSATASATALPTNTAVPTSSPTRVPTMSPTPSATATESPTPEPTATEVPPPPDQLPDVLGRGQTSYAGSIPARAHNVELATRRLNGVMVPPGGIFSFNKALGPSTLDAGFKIGYGITLANDRPKTVPSVAGGICQVATTLFQAAYWAGLEMVERNYHLYWIPRYGQPPTGVKGLDATVDDPWADLRFRNTTGNWIKIESWADGANIGFTIRGVEPGWKVQSEGPVISNVVRANHTLVREETLTLPPGETMDVEHAEDGFDATMTRRVFDKDGDPISTYRFTNHYRPSRNVLLVGVRALSAVSSVSTDREPTPNPIVTVPPVTTAEAVVVRPSPQPAAVATRPAEPTVEPAAREPVPTLPPTGQAPPPLPTLPARQPAGPGGQPSQPVAQPPASQPPPQPVNQLPPAQPPSAPPPPLPPAQQAVPTLPPAGGQAPLPQLPPAPTPTPRGR